MRAWYERKWWRWSMKIKDCPFCGDRPTVEPWHGGSKTKHMVRCENDDCPTGPGCTGKTRDAAIATWNKRAPS